MKFYKDFFGYRVYHMDNFERKVLGLKTFVAGATKTGEIIVFDEFFRLPQNSRKFILMHEIGHIQSFPDTSEETANNWAISHIDGPRDEIMRIMNQLYFLTENMKDSVRRELNIV